MSFIETIKKGFNNNWCILGLFTLIVTALYINVIQGPFIWDARALVIDNEYIHSFEHAKHWFTGETIQELGRNSTTVYRPISKAVYASIYHFAELNVIPYHIVLMLIHVINTFLVFTLLQKFKCSRFGSFLAALLFLVHPVHTTMISYIAGIPDAISSLFILLGLLFFLQKKSAALIGAVLCFIIAMLAKESGIILLGLSALIAIYDWKHFGKKEKKAKLIFFLTLGGVTALYFWLRLTYINPQGLVLNKMDYIYTQSLLVRMMTFISTVWDYTKLIFAPVGLYFDRIGYHYQTLLTFRGIFGIIVIITGLIGSYISFKKDKKFFLGFFWIFVALGPVSGIIPVNAIYRENWLYIPMIGVGILLSLLWDKISKKKPTTFIAIYMIVITLLSTATIYRNFEWADAHAFFENEIEHNNTHPRIYNQYARLHFREGNHKKAIEFFSEAISISAPDDPGLANIHYDLGTAYLLNKDLNSAIVHYLLTFNTEPNHLKAHEQLTKLFTLGNHHERAAKFAEFTERIKNGEQLTLEEIKTTKDLK